MSGLQRAIRHPDRANDEHERARTLASDALLGPARPRRRSLARRASQRLRAVPGSRRGVRGGRGAPAEPPRRPPGDASGPGCPGVARPRRRGPPGAPRHGPPDPRSASPRVDPPGRPRLQRHRGGRRRRPPRRAPRGSHRHAGRQRASRGQPGPGRDADRRRHPAGGVGAAGRRRDLCDLVRRRQPRMPGRRCHGVRDAGRQRRQARVPRREALVDPAPARREPRRGRRRGRRLRRCRGPRAARHNAGARAVSGAKQRACSITVGVGGPGFSSGRLPRADGISRVAGARGESRAHASRRPPRPSPPRRPDLRSPASRRARGRRRPCRRSRRPRPARPRPRPWRSPRA